MQRFAATTGTNGTGRKRRRSTVKQRSSSVRISAGRLMCSSAMNGPYGLRYVRSKIRWATSDGRTCRPGCLARDHREELAALLVEQAPRLAHAGRKVRQVLEDVDRDVAVEVAVGQVRAGLAVADDRADGRVLSPNDLGRVLAQLEGVVLALLLGREALVLADTGADLQRAPEPGREWRTGNEWLNRSTTPYRWRRILCQRLTKSS
jgi:hypothetical protein